MRKRIFSTLFICIGFCYLHAQDSIYYSILWKPKPAQKEAKVLREDVYEYKFLDGIVTDSGLLEIKIYDTLGLVLQQKSFRNYQQVSELANFYSGAILDSSVERVALPHDTIVRKYVYDASGRLFQITTIRRQRPALTEQYVYNSLNQPIQIVSKTESGKEYISARYEYQSDHLIKSIQYFEEDPKKRRTGFIYSYDKKKRKTTRLIAFPGGTSMMDCVRTYNEEQQLIKLERPSRATVLNESEIFRMNRWDEEEIYIYYPNGLLKEKQVNRNGKLYRVEKHFYLP